MRKLTAILGSIFVFGAAGTDDMYLSAGQTPPESNWLIYFVGIALLIVCLILAARKAKK